MHLPDKLLRLVSEKLKTAYICGTYLRYLQTKTISPITSSIPEVWTLDYNIANKFRENGILVQRFKKSKYKNGFTNYSFAKNINEALTTIPINLNSLIYDIKNQKFINNKPITHIEIKEESLLENSDLFLLLSLYYTFSGIPLGSATSASVAKFLPRAYLTSAKTTKDIIIGVLSYADKPSVFFKSLLALKYIFPELHECMGIDQTHKSMDVFDHIMLCLDNSPKDLILRLALLFHDIAKPYTKIGDNFYGHDRDGAHLAYRCLIKWGFPNRIISKTIPLVRNHNFDTAPNLTNKAIKRLISRIGVENIANLILVRKIDRHSSGIKNIPMRKIDKFERKVNTILKKEKNLPRKLVLSDTNIKKIIGPPDISIEGLDGARNLLKNALESGRVTNDRGALRNYLKTFIKDTECPYGREFLFRTQKNVYLGTAKRFQDKKLQCGAFCGWRCDSWTNF